MDKSLLKTTWRSNWQSSLTLKKNNICLVLMWFQLAGILMFGKWVERILNELLSSMQFTVTGSASPSSTILLFLEADDERSLGALRFFVFFDRYAGQLGNFEGTAPGANLGLSLFIWTVSPFIWCVKYFIIESSSKWSSQTLWVGFKITSLRGIARLHFSSKSASYIKIITISQTFASKEFDENLSLKIIF